MTDREIPETNRVGFAGTGKGMADRQARAVAAVLRRLRPDVVHHGDCLGADEQFDAIAAAQGVRRVAHPCHLRGRPEAAYRAFCAAERVHQPKAPLARNREIVARCQTMIVAPRGPEASLPRSGTWAVYHYAQAAGRCIMVVWPDGTTNEESHYAKLNTNPH